MITKELREYVWKKVPSKHLEDLISIADRIEGRYEDCEGFARRLEEAAEKREDVTLFGVDYVALPLDANGKAIRAGDKLDGYGMTISVKEIRYEGWGWVLVSRGGESYYDAAAFEHVQPDSWERIISEFAERVINSGHQWGLDAPAITAEFVERCKRLAGEDA